MGLYKSSALIFLKFSYGVNDFHNWQDNCHQILNKQNCMVKLFSMGAIALFIGITSCNSSTNTANGSKDSSTSTNAAMNSADSNAVNSTTNGQMADTSKNQAVPGSNANTGNPSNTGNNAGVNNGSNPDVHMNTGAPSTNGKNSGIHEKKPKGTTPTHSSGKQ